MQNRKSKIKSVLLGCVVAVATAAIPLVAQDSEVLSILEKELTRNMQNLKMELQEKPYFISYSILDNHYVRIRASKGALIESTQDRTRSLDGDVRVGSYIMDNTGLKPGSQESETDWTDRYYYSRMFAPLDNATDTLHHRLWQLTDYRYKTAVQDYLKRKSEGIYEVPDEEEKGVDAFSKEEPVTMLESEVSFSPDKNGWKEKTKKYSSYLSEQPGILSSIVFLYAGAYNWYFINSEGTKIQSGDHFAMLKAEAFSRTKEGIPVFSYRRIYAQDADKLPGEETYKKELENLSSEIKALLEAQEMESFTGPVLLAPEPAALFIHQMAGHYLTGNKSKKDSGYEAGMPVLPDFLSLEDDPLQEIFNGTPLVGHYKVDDEGVKPQSVLLVENGKIKNYVMSRKPIKGFPKSNGHGRAQEWGKATARLANTFVKASKTYTAEELKKKLIVEVKKQRKDYGLYVVSALNREEGHQLFYGPTDEDDDTSALNFAPLIAYKVFAKDGHMELVRNVKLISGSAKTLSMRIIAAGNDAAAYNGLCSQGEGSIYTSTISPSLLISEMEVKKYKGGKRRPPILPSP